MLRAALLWGLLLTSEAFAVPLPHPRPAALKVKANPEARSEKPEPELKAEKLKPSEALKADEKPVTEAEQVPLPAPKPADILEIDPEIVGPTPPPPGLVEAEVPLDPIPDPVCDALEKSGEAEFERLPRIIEGDCGALTPIRLKALTPKDGQRVPFENPVTTNCQITTAALGWLTGSVQPAALKHLGGPITKFRQTGGYECRGRNRVVGAKMSEHGRANALDIGGFERADGKVVPVHDQGEAELGFLMEIRTAACGPFTTVLGPGVEAHAEHFHLDLARRGKDGRTTYCR
jgi:hypothetical protein